MVTPVSAVLLKDYDTFGKMDPYVVVQVGATKKKTKPHSGGGKKPKWTGEVLTFNDVLKSAEVKIDLYDEDTGSDDYIGGATINASGLSS